MTEYLFHMMKTITVVILVAVALSGKLFAQDYLLPSHSLEPPDYNGNHYYGMVLPVLFSGLSDQPLARYTIPLNGLIGSGLVLSVEKDDSGICRMILRSSAYNDWSWLCGNEITMDEESIIEPEFVTLVHSLFTTAIGQEKPGQLSLGLGGSLYYFSTTDLNGSLTTAEVWLPREYSRLRGLVEVCNAVVSLVTGNNEDFDATADRIKDLITELQQ